MFLYLLEGSFNLETITFWIPMKGYQTLVESYMETFQVKLLEKQQELQIMLVNFIVDDAGEPTPSDYLHDGIKECLFDWVNRNQDFLSSHPSLKWLRFNNYDIVLKNTLSKNDIARLDQLNSEFGWKIRELDLLDPDVVQTLPFEKLNITIT